MNDPNDELICDRCGNDCSEGYEIHYHGKPDPETGYRDQEIVCALCCQEDGRWDAADMAYDLSYED